MTTWPPGYPIEHPRDPIVACHRFYRRDRQAAVKLFPASVAGPAFVREFRGPFPDIPLVPTGGVTAETAPAFIRAGAIAVGIGSWLIGDGEPAGIAERGAIVAGTVAEARAAR